MNSALWAAKTGLDAQQTRMTVVSHNLANVSTNGFRAELTAFRAVPIRGDGASTRVFSLETTPGYNDEQGPINATGRNLDVALTGKSWLAVQGLDGTEAYTRGGALDVTSEGALVTLSGLPVIGDGGPIQVPANSAVSIGGDGTVIATSTTGKITTVGKLKLVTPETPLQRGEDGLFRGADGDLTADTKARVQEGALEGSNVSAVETMVSMITAARQFEAQMKMLQTAEGDEKAAGQLLSMN